MEYMMRDVTAPSPLWRRIVDVASWVLLAVWLLICVGLTVWVVTAGRDPAVLIIVWPLSLFMLIGPLRSRRRKNQE
jgi:hypothetical protein